MYRQGDVLILPAKMPAEREEVDREGGRVILAHGEVTGHAHAFSRSGVEMYRSESDARFMRVAGATTASKKKAAAAFNAAIRDADVETARRIADQAETDGLAALRHEEHKPIIHAPGSYEVRIQREYSPGAIRNVAD